MTLLSDIQYFSPIVWYLKLNNISNCIFDPYEPFRKMSFRNRCTLLGPNGPVNLSIPLIGGRGQKREMKEVRISTTERWQIRHWRTLTSCYNHSPWFEYFRDELDILYTRPFTFLMDWNLTCFHWVADKMSIPTPISLLSAPLPPDPGSGWDDWRGYLMPATLHGNFPVVHRYPQVFEDRFGFVPHLSILDLLFCMGPSALQTLQE